MEPTKKEKPENVLLLPELDCELIQALARHWLVIVQIKNDRVLIELYRKK